MSKSHRFRLVQFRENRTRRLTLCSLFNHARYNSANRMNATGYDNAGNQTEFGANTLFYDAENHIKDAYEAPAAGGRHTQYVYDGDGRRVMKITENGPAQTYVYL